MKAAFIQAYSSAPIYKFDKKFLGHLEYLERVQSDILDLEQSYRMQIGLLQTLIGVEYQGLENTRYKKVADKILNEFANKYVEMINASLQKVLSTLKSLQLSFLEIAMAK
jgi:hypothetical protein